MDLATQLLLLALLANHPASPHVHVVLTVDPLVARRELAHAEREASRLLAPAGTIVDWEVSDAPPATIDGSRGESATRRIDLRLVGCRRSLEFPCERGLLGRAVHHSDEVPHPYALIYVEPIRTFAEPTYRSRGRLMGRVMAHELVHLLAGPGAHDESPLMRPAWSENELDTPLDAARSISQNVRDRVQASFR